jgi:hypothetical protein
LSLALAASRRIAAYSSPLTKLCRILEERSGIGYRRERWSWRANGRGTRAKKCTKPPVELVRRRLAKACSTIELVCPRKGAKAGQKL